LYLGSIISNQFQRFEILEWASLFSRIVKKLTAYTRCMTLRSNILCYFYSFQLIFFYMCNRYFYTKYKMSYAIVEFIRCTSSAVIPTNWFTDHEENACYWPKKWNAARRDKAVQERQEPSHSWGTHSIRCLGKAGRRACINTAQSTKCIFNSLCLVLVCFVEL